MMTMEQLISDAAQLAKRLESDIIECRTRDEHIRVSARANEAANLLAGMVLFRGEAALPLYDFESATFTVDGVVEQPRNISGMGFID
jgi:hypothetical protein